MTTYESKTTSFFIKVVTFLVFSFFFLFSVNARARAAELDHQAPYTNIHVEYDETTVVYTLESFNFTNRYVFDGIVKIGFKNDSTDYLWVKTSKNEVYCICTNDLPDSMKNANRKIMRKDTYSVGTFIEMNTYLYKFEDLTDFTISNSLTPVPTQKPTTVPTRKPTATPTQKPTIKPTAEPTATPTTVTVAETQQDAVSTTSMTNVSDAVSSVQTTEQPASQQPVQYVTYAEMLEAIKQAAQNSSVTTVVKATATPKVKTTKKTKSTATPKATKKPVATAKPKATKKPKTKLKKKSSKAKKKKVSNSDSDEKYSSVSLSEIIQYNEESKTLIISKTKKQVIKDVKEYGYTEKGTNVFIKNSSLYKIKNNKIKLVKKNIIAFCYDEDDNVSKYVIKKAGKPVAIPINF